MSNPPNWFCLRLHLSTFFTIMRVLIEYVSEIQIYNFYSFPLFNDPVILSENEIHLSCLHELILRSSISDWAIWEASKHQVLKTSPDGTIILYILRIYNINIYLYLNIKVYILYVFTILYKLPQEFNDLPISNLFP